jgi:hypothetical protein
MAKLEFYIGSAEGHIAVLNDMAVPRKGEFVNIKKITYKVKRVTWAVDHADAIDWRLRQLRANIELEII